MVEDLMNFSFGMRVPSQRYMKLKKWETSKLRNSAAAKRPQGRWQAVSSGKRCLLMEVQLDVFKIGVKEDTS